MKQPKKIRLSPGLLLRIYRAIKAVVREVEGAREQDSPGGDRVTKEEIFAISVVAADRVAEVLYEELVAAAA